MSNANSQTILEMVESELRKFFGVRTLVVPSKSGFDFSTPRTPKTPRSPRIPKTPKSLKSPKIPKTPKTPKIPKNSNFLKSQINISLTYKSCEKLQVLVQKPCFQNHQDIIVPLKGHLEKGHAMLYKVQDLVIKYKQFEMSNVLIALSEFTDFLIEAETFFGRSTNSDAKLREYLERSEITTQKLHKCICDQENRSFTNSQWTSLRRTKMSIIGKLHALKNKIHYGLHNGDFDNIKDAPVKFRTGKTRVTKKFYKKENVVVASEELGYFSDDEVEEYLNQEIACIQGLASECSNILQYYGYTHEEHKFHVISNWTEYTLQEFLSCPEFKHERQWSRKISIARGIASALKHCHELQDCILHCNLTSDHVLLTENLEPRLRFLTIPKEHSLSRWSPPEFWENLYDSKSEIYSFALILWEIASEKLPFKKIKNCYKIRGKRPNPISFAGTPIAYQDIMVKGWDQCPDDRPTIREISDVLEELESAFTAEYNIERVECTSSGLDDVDDQPMSLLVDIASSEDDLIPATSIDQEYGNNRDGKTSPESDDVDDQLMSPIIDNVLSENNFIPAININQECESNCDGKTSPKSGEVDNQSENDFTKTLRRNTTDPDFLECGNNYDDTPSCASSIRSISPTSFLQDDDYFSPAVTSPDALSKIPENKKRVLTSKPLQSLDEAIAFHKKKSYGRAFKIFKEHADYYKTPIANFWTGYYYYKDLSQDNRGINVNRDASINYLYQAAMHELPDAQYWYARLIIGGKTAKEHKNNGCATAMELLKKAAEANHLDSMRMYGHYLISGRYGVVPDVRAGKAFIKKCDKMRASMAANNKKVGLSARKSKVVDSDTSIKSNRSTKRSVYNTSTGMTFRKERALSAPTKSTVATSVAASAIAKRRADSRPISFTKINNFKDDHKGRSIGHTHSLSMTKNTKGRWE